MKSLVSRRLEQVGCGLDEVAVNDSAVRANKNRTTSQWTRNHSLANLATLSTLVILILAIGHWPSSSLCLEEDAQILMPIANLAKGIIKTVTLGVPLDVPIDARGIVKNFAYFTWRTGFPVTMPGDFFRKAQDFYNRVRSRVAKAPVTNVERKSLVGLRQDLDEIVDAIVDQVRKSPDGLYTDYLQTRVGNTSLPLEDACTLVGVQLKAYGVDLSNYRDIAGAVLGIPVMPTVASTVMNVASIGNSGLGMVQNITSNALVRPLSQTTNMLLSRVPLPPVPGRQSLSLGNLLPPFDL